MSPITSYQKLFGLLKLLPPAWTHQMAINALQYPFWLTPPHPIPGSRLGPVTCGGLDFENRLGIAAGFDKDAQCLRGIERMGASFVELGTVLVEPYAGQPLRPNLKRLIKKQALWNRLGFPSQGAKKIVSRLRAYRRQEHRTLKLASNIGPHPGHLKTTTTPKDFMFVVKNELETLVTALHETTDFFVVNLSSPNTPGLRTALAQENLLADAISHLRHTLENLDNAKRRPVPTPLLLKLPPEDPNQNSWTPETLAALVEPILSTEALSGFVSTNTSIKLARQYAAILQLNSVPNDLPGGVSGLPLHQTAVNVTRMLRKISGPDTMIIGCGGIMAPKDAHNFLDAGADLVEMYTGLVYQGPGLITQCLNY